MAVLNVNFFSNALFRIVPVTVVLPTDKVLPGEQTYQSPRLYKTLYLLHGLRGNNTAWVNGTRIQALANERNLCVVMPSGDNKFYADSSRSADYYGKFLTEDLIAFAENSFPLSRRREDRFIAGLSMGGYGALTNGLRHPELYSHIAALSSALIKERILRAKEGPLTDQDYAANDYFNRAAYETMFDLDSIQDFENSECDYEFLARRVAKRPDKPEIFLCCGTEDSLLGYNRAYRDLLTGLGYSLRYEESAGDHTWAYWDYAIERVLDWLPLEDRCAGITSEEPHC